MKMVKLDSITLKNFKGLSDFALESLAKADRIAVHGDNGTGKTSLADGFHWLLFDKDSLGRTDFAIKPLDKLGEPQHGIETTVKACLDIDGQALCLEKRFREKWTKKRGSATKTFTGHQTRHFINDVPVKRAEYLARIKELADPEILRLLSDPFFFTERQPWEKRRALLLEVCGDISDKQVIKSTPELAGLPDILEEKSLDDFMKVAHARRKELNRELQEIPARIDEADKALPDTGDLNQADIKKQLDLIRKDSSSILQEIETLKAGGKVAALRKELAEVDVQLIELKNKHAAAHAPDEETRQKLSQADKALAMVDQETSRIQIKADSLESQKAALAKEIEALREKWFAIDSRNFEPPETDDICPACGQVIPESLRDKALKEARARFNQDNALELEEINKAGQQKRRELEELEASLKQLSSDMEAARARKAELEKSFRALNEELEASAKPSPVEELPEYKRLQTQHRGLLRRIEAHRENSQGEITKFERRLDALSQKEEKLREQLAAFDMRERGLKRIEELKAQERSLAAEFEELEGKLHICELFMRQKVSLLEEKISSKFQFVRFKLFEQQVNGGLRPCCEIVVDGVPYRSLNTASRINAGLDVINTLSGHYGLCAPVFIDGAESVTQILPTKSQQIRLVVDPSCKELTVKKETSKNV